MADEPVCVKNMPGDHDLQPVTDWYDDGDETTPAGNEYRDLRCTRCDHKVTEGRTVKEEDTDDTD